MDSQDLFQKVNSSLGKHLFDLGWDYFAAKQGMPNDASNYPSFVEGYETAKTRLKAVRADRHYLKWLQIRYGALKRNRLFDETVTPQVIAQIDVDICPITLEKLTHSTGGDLDWSIDRVQNQIGYSLGNIIVVSTRANKAKGAMTYEEVLEACYAEEPVNGLTPTEWMRWRFICSLTNSRKNDEDKISFGYYCAPYVTELPPMVLVNPSYVLQYAITQKAIYHDSAIYKKIILSLPKHIRKELNGLVNDASKLRDRINKHECEIWFNQGLFKKFTELFKKLSPQVLNTISSNLDKCHGFTRKAIANIPSWDPDLKGYNR